MAAGKLGWRIFGGLTTLAAVIVTKKVVDSSWRFVTGNEPPANPEDPDTTWQEAVAWSLASGVGVAVARLLATRQAATVWRRWTGELPPGIKRDDDGKDRQAIAAAAGSHR